jgi:hypothetical protein
MKKSAPFILLPDHHARRLEAEPAGAVTHACEQLSLFQEHT